MLNKRFLGVIILLFVVLPIFCSTFCFAVVKIDVTGMITETSSGTHNCNNYAVNKFDTKNHWKECSRCSSEYEKMGKPVEANIWLKHGYLEVKTNSSNQRMLVIKGTFKVHSYTNQYWTMGESCSPDNKLVHVCTCGYSYKTNNTRSHGKTEIEYNHTEYFYRKKCSVCNYNYEYHECKNRNGKNINCSNLGVCALCGEEYLEVLHSTGKLKKENGSYEIICKYCGKKFGKQTEHYEKIGEKRYRYYIQTEANEVVKELSWVGVYIEDNSIASSENLKYEVNGKKITISADIVFKTFPEYIPTITIYYHFNNLVRSVSQESIKLDITAPNFNVSQSAISSQNGWVTQSNIVITGTENYCSTVNIEMKDKVSNKVIYSGKASVDKNTKKFSYTFKPNVTVGINAKEYEITVKDSFGNSGSKTITISKSDRIAPIAVKGGQLDSSNIWSTTTNWSQTKDFVIRATDEGSNIANIKIQHKIRPFIVKPINLQEM